MRDRSSSAPQSKLSMRSTMSSYFANDINLVELYTFRACLTDPDQSTAWLPNSHDFRCNPVPTLGDSLSPNGVTNSPSRRLIETSPSENAIKRPAPSNMAAISVIQSLHPPRTLAQNPLLQREKYNRKTALAYLKCGAGLVVAFQ